MPVITPTVGRVVLFVPEKAKYEFGFCFAAGREHAAIVTAVHGDRCVNLAAFDANGKTHGFTSVTLVQPDDTTPPGDHCRWMQFQVGQAAKAEELQKAVDAARAV